MSESDTESEAESESDAGVPRADESGAKVFVAIYQATSLSSFDQLDNPSSLASQVARARGGGQFEGEDGATDSAETDSADNLDVEQPPEGYRMRLEEGKIKADTGYMMRFVTKDHLNLDIFDVLTIPDLRSYPVPQSVISSLPPHIHGMLETQGYVKVRGGYDYNNSRFYAARQGWETSEDGDPDPWDRLMELIRLTGSVPTAIDYLYVEEGPDRWGLSQTAESRGVTEHAVKSNVRAVKNELND